MTDSALLVDPTTAPAPPDSAPASPLEALAGRKVALVRNAWPSWHRMVDRLGSLLADREDAATQQYLVPNGSAADPQQLRLIAASADAAVVGLANCGSCTAWSHHDAVVLSSLGLPVVLVVTSEFTSLVAALAVSAGVRLPTVTIDVNPETVPEATALTLLDDAYDAIVAALTTPPAAGPALASHAAGAAGAARATSAGELLVTPEPSRRYADEADAVDRCHDLGWTDGLPVIPPTVHRVDAILAVLGDPDDVVASMPPSGAPVTNRALAANAVMAGCQPGHLPVLTAIVRAVCVPEFNLNGIATTTGPSTPFAVVSGPAAEQAGLNSGRGALGPGWRANASIGRALRLLIGNVGGARPAEVSKSIIGQPGRYTMCIAENEARSPWEPLHVTLGLDDGQSAVTVLSATGTMNVLTPRSDVDAMLTILADALAYLGNPNVVMGRGTVGVLVTPGHAEAMAQAGLSKAEVAAELWARSSIPIGRFPASAHPDPPYEFILRDGRVYPVAGPEHIYVIVAGGPEPTHATVVPSHPSCHPVTAPVR